VVFVNGTNDIIIQIILKNHSDRSQEKEPNDDFFRFWIFDEILEALRTCSRVFFFSRFSLINVKLQLNITSLLDFFNQFNFLKTTSP
jgi:hypothetical protein